MTVSFFTRTRSSGTHVLLGKGAKDLPKGPPSTNTGSDHWDILGIRPKRRKLHDKHLWAHVCVDVFAEGDGELPTTQLPLLICSNFISIC